MPLNKKVINYCFMKFYNFLFGKLLIFKKVFKTYNN